MRADVDGGDEDYGAPDHLKAGSEAELEAVLLRRLESTEPGVEATPQFWERLREAARARHDAGSGRRAGGVRSHSGLHSRYNPRQSHSP